MRLIDADALGKRVKEFRDDAPQSSIRRYVCNVILSMLGDENQTPTIEAEPVRHGCEYCIGLPKNMREDFTMPNASKRDFDIVTIKFCPMCGAKMDGDGHD